MNNIDNIIRNLYLCNTNSREKMQQALIENVLYTLDTAMTSPEINEFINSEFHIELDSHELNVLLQKLAYDNIIIKDTNNKFSISLGNKDKIYRNVIDNQEKENKRNQNIITHIKTYGIDFTNDEQLQIANIFNEYIYECFLEDGRNAIQYFRPYNNNELSNNSLLKSKLNTLTNPSQKKIFEKLVLNYPDTLTKEELAYLDNIATKAEYFFALGIPEQDFNKFQELKLQGHVILVDTNFIYSILKLHSHHQNENCTQIVKLISNNKIDCRLGYIKKTLLELKKRKTDFEKYITRETLTRNQIQSLLDSEQLSSIAKDYFEKKLIDRDTPHPADKIQYGTQILKSNHIEIFNYQFPQLEEQVYINAKFQEYYDYYNLKNEARIQSGLPEKLVKDDKRLEHDIYLREAIISLRKKKNKTNDIDYICLTLDKELIDFDRYANRKKGIHQETPAPNFILPSIFLRRIRPFIPIITDDYKKAFITSITANTIDNAALFKHSEVVQRSMSYFNKLGIDDTNVILSIIRQELFYKEFLASEENNTAEEFIRGELDKRIEALEKEKKFADKQLIAKEREKEAAVAKEKEKNEQLKQEIGKKYSDFIQKEEYYKSEIERIKDEKSSTEFDKSKLNIEYQKNMLSDKKKYSDDKRKILKPIEEQANQKYNRFILTFIMVIISYFLLLAFISYKIGWDIMEPITYFLGAIGICFGYLYLAIYGKNLNPQKFFEKKKNQYKNEEYLKFGFSINDYSTLETEIINLEQAIENLEKQHNQQYQEI